MTTDFATELEQTRARIVANQPPAPDPVRIDLAQTRRNAKVGAVFHAYMEDSDMWDGWALYDNLADALQGAASDYVSGEYGSDQADPEERYDGVLEWRFAYGSWCLFDEDRDTGVYVTETAVFAARTGQEAPATAAAEPEYVCDVCEDDFCGHCSACTCPACTEVRQISAATVSAEQQVLAAARARVEQLPAVNDGHLIAESRRQILDAITRTGQEG